MHFFFLSLCCPLTHYAHLINASPSPKGCRSPKMYRKICGGLWHQLEDLDWLLNIAHHSVLKAWHCPLTPRELRISAFRAKRNQGVLALEPKFQEWQLDGLTEGTSHVCRHCSGSSQGALRLWFVWFGFTSLHICGLPVFREQCL